MTHREDGRQLPITSASMDPDNNEINRAAVDRVVVILPVDTSAHWFHDYVLDANAVCFVGPGRISFEGEGPNPSFSLLIVVCGPVNDELADALNTLGATIRGRSIYDPAPQQTLVTDGDQDARP